VFFKKLFSVNNKIAVQNTAAFCSS